MMGDGGEKDANHEVQTKIHGGSFRISYQRFVLYGMRWTALFASFIAGVIGFFATFDLILRLGIGHPAFGYPWWAAPVCFFFVAFLIGISRVARWRARELQ